MIRVLRLLRAAAGADQDLLGRYVRDHDDRAFEALVGRYGPGVWAACVRLAGCEAEDAFQAVFLILSQKAGTVTGSIPAWLHAVTRRVTANLRRKARRRNEAEASAEQPPDARADDVEVRERLALLDEELSRMPERYRAVLIVCCLEGRSRDEAAAQLGWSEGQVKGRLERAREMLRGRLARRGVELGAVLLAATVAGPVPGLADPPSAAAITLSHGVTRAMSIQKLKPVVVLTVCVGVALAGGVLLRAQPGTPATPNTYEERPEKRATAEDKKTPSPKEQKDEPVQKINDLQKERIATLTELVDVNSRLYKAARTTYDDLLEARLLLLQAELDAAEKETDRIALFKKCVDALKEYGEWAQARADSGRGTNAAVLKIKARRLEVQIQLEQAKAKEAKAGK